MFPKIVDSVQRYGSMNDEEAERILSDISGYTSVFGAPTSIKNASFPFGKGAFFAFMANRGELSSFL